MQWNSKEVSTSFTKSVRMYLKVIIIIMSGFKAGSLNRVVTVSTAQAPATLCQI